MNRVLSRYLILALVALGIVVPQASAALAGLGLVDDRIMVICTGDGLRTVRINANGDPVEISEDAEFCALSHATDAVSPAHLGILVQRLLYVGDAPLYSGYRPVSQWFSLSLPRAPPCS